jgi:hypothetical protein
VVSSYPLRSVLHNLNATGNIAKGPTDLAKFEQDFIPRHAVKSQVLAHFVVDWTSLPCHQGGPDDGELDLRAPVFTTPHWTLFFDGSS